MVDPLYLRELIVSRRRQHRETYAQAREGLKQIIPLEILDQVIDEMKRDAHATRTLTEPRGVLAKLSPEALAAEVRQHDWYVGPQQGDIHWPQLRETMHETGLRAALDSIDAASDKIVGNLADPTVRDLKKKGLVVGHVQSGKTANYTSVMAKAADAGYRLFIVFAGMHNNLRRQTQERLDVDLIDPDLWARLTNEVEDFGTVTNGAPLLAKKGLAIAVVKKNSTRLRKLRDWLRDIPEEIRRTTPVLVLDDEADQATPNTKAAANELSAINRLVREVWDAIPSGSYVGYTATPFANVFMDPDDDAGLYPSDFILDLPRSGEYFGAERIFGRVLVSDAGEPDPGLDMVRQIPSDDVGALQPPTDRDARQTFTNPVVPSLDDAVRWFVLSVATRRVRGQGDQHSSMLVHTTHYVDPHWAMKAAIDRHLTRLGDEVGRGATESFRRLWVEESTRVASVATLPLPDWAEVEVQLAAVLNNVRVVVDNGQSEDRLQYGRRGHDEQPVVETVIAVGGGTLSRGLTLEGLVVSYFTRTSNTYDTLLQMGRWFGYRPGYEDLPRIWMTADMAHEFQFLAGVEEEIRREMRKLQNTGVTPKEFGLRIRAHPGRLEITARSKMVHADEVATSLSGARQQTILLHERDPATLRRNLGLARQLIVGRIEVGADVVELTPNRWLLEDVPIDSVLQFLGDYEFHPDQVGLRPDLMQGWVTDFAPSRPWNVVVLGLGADDGLGTVDLGLPRAVPTINRAPLKEVEGLANIKGLMSLRDRVADLDPEIVRAANAAKDGRLADDDYQRLRRQHADAGGLLVIYPVSKRSSADRGYRSRRPMHADEHLIGLGIIFPETTRADRRDGDFWSVRRDWELVDDEIAEELPVDTEGSAVVDGSKVDS